MIDLPSYTASKANWDLIPDYMVGGLRRYIENGIEPGSFLSNLLRNDLKGTFLAADSTNVYLVRDYVDFLYNFAPSNCWGSEEKYEAWVKQGGLGAKEIAS
jgi:hypothetical protein